jgi:hypothetical protein
MPFWRIFAAPCAPPHENPRRMPAVAAVAPASGLTMRQRRGAICIDPEQRCGNGGHLHDFKTTAPIAALR